MPIMHKFELRHSNNSPNGEYIYINNEHIGLIFDKEYGRFRPRHMLIINKKTGMPVFIDFHALLKNESFGNDRITFFYGWNDEIKNSKMAISYKFRQTKFMGEWGQT